MHNLLLFLAVIVAPLSAAAAEASMQVQGKSPLQLVVESLPIVWTVLGTLFPVFIAFYRRDRDALERLLKAVPDIWDVVQREKRKERVGIRVVDPLARALELAAGQVQRSLTPVETARVKTAIVAYNERMKIAGAKATPVTVGGLPVTNAAPTPAIGEDLTRFRRIDLPVPPR